MYMPHLYSPWENGFEKPDYLAIWIFFLLKYAPTYAALGKVVVKSKYVLAVVKALDVVARGRVVRAPMRGSCDSDERFRGQC